MEARSLPQADDSCLIQAGGPRITKIIWMSDPHFQNEGTIDGLDPRARLAAAINHANAHHADADFAILSGDLVGDDIVPSNRVSRLPEIRPKSPLMWAPPEEASSCPKVPFCPAKTRIRAIR